MTLDLEIVGVQSEPAERSWTESDVALYALAVGAGHNDPLLELDFTTENSTGVETHVLPTFANLIIAGGVPAIGTYDPAGVVHAEQSFHLNHPLPPSGCARSTTTVTGIYDKGSAALVTWESTAVDVATDAELATVQTSIFIRGAGGFGGDRGPSPTSSMPEREPDMQVVTETRPEQALLYRLTGDRNPLHSDPEFAKRGGFSQPILHGMCTYGYTGRLLLHALCASDVRRFHSMTGRFTEPVLPGQDLTVHIWETATGHGANGFTDSPIRTAHFRTTSNGVTVLDRGRLTYTA
ncbi:MaoC/PaaZ C-terminal domain-containing protein [Rhodococcus wratislaviensis]|uniref:Putative enoyl-CoA hydratase n=1 Tax=Rhodococcus wratislaviensis NBRC 100605 TaxID=1219028 RepID=X0PRJ2_RHOWR|nr:MaoC/PaaZ C-terminal domain-containing protein [Rhodococcus wratislaviensis]GAF45529.1 putative enoyl-CoA hydratase [Rhodococcus wratislaviensis NBRC 100605]